MTKINRLAYILFFAFNITFGQTNIKKIKVTYREPINRHIQGVTKYVGIDSVPSFINLKGKLINEKNEPLANAKITYMDSCNKFSDITDFYGGFYFNDIPACSHPYIIFVVDKMVLPCESIIYDSKDIPSSYRDCLSNDSFKIQVTSRKILLDFYIPHRIFFEYGNINFKESDILNKMLDSTNIYSFFDHARCFHGFYLTMTGFMTNSEKQKYGEALMKERMEMVRAFFISKGMDPRRIKTSYSTENTSFHSKEEAELQKDNKEYLDMAKKHSRIEIEVVYR